MTTFQLFSGLGPSTNFKDTDPLQTSQLRSDVPSFDSAKGGPGSTCIKCANDLPVLRRLGIHLFSLMFILANERSRYSVVEVC